MGEAPAIIFEGKKYLPSADAAELVGYTKDYIGQLARAGKIESRIVGRSWYIAEDSILEHKKTVHYTLTKKKKPRKNTKGEHVSRKKDINVPDLSEESVNTPNNFAKGPDTQYKEEKDHETPTPTPTGIGVAKGSNTVPTNVMPSVHEAFIQSGMAEGVVVGHMPRATLGIGNGDNGNRTEGNVGIVTERSLEQPKNVTVSNANAGAALRRDHVQMTEAHVTPRQRAFPAASAPPLVLPLPPQRRPGFTHRAHLEHDVHFEQGQPLFFEDDRPVHPEPFRLVRNDGDVLSSEPKDAVSQKARIGAVVQGKDPDVAVVGFDRAKTSSFTTLEGHREHRPELRTGVHHRAVPTADGIVVPHQGVRTRSETREVHGSTRSSREREPVPRTKTTFAVGTVLALILILAGAVAAYLVFLD